MTYRHTIDRTGTPIQQSMTVDIEDYGAQNVNTLMLGVILYVYPSDHSSNRSAILTTERHGHRHEATVLVQQDGTAGYSVLQNVVIPPSSPSGIDDFEEHLPRGSSSFVTGVQFDPGVHQVDPNELDGDWCVVGFIGGQLTSPCIISWWPHPRNVYDTATSGLANHGKSLRQAGRYFSRKNGVETVITTAGDVILSTRFANSSIQVGTEPSEGRFARQETVNGGSISVQVKPSQIVEFMWDKPSEGTGVQGLREAEVPQTNPPLQERLPIEKVNTYIRFDAEYAEISVPVQITLFADEAVVVESGQVIEITAGEEYSVSAGSDVSVTSESLIEQEAPRINIGTDAEEPVVLGNQFKTWLESMTVDTPMGPAKISQSFIDQISDFLSEKVFGS